MEEPRSSRRPTTRSSRLVLEHACRDNNGLYDTLHEVYVEHGEPSAGHRSARCWFPTGTTGRVLPEVIEAAVRNRQSEIAQEAMDQVPSMCSKSPIGQRDARPIARLGDRPRRGRALVRGSGRAACPYLVPD